MEHTVKEGYQMFRLEELQEYRDGEVGYYVKECKQILQMLRLFVHFKIKECSKQLYQVKYA